MPPFTIITGASSGIGLATAILFAKKGYHLLLLARRSEKLQHSIDNRQDGFTPERVLVLHCDVTKADQYKNCIEQAKEHFGGPVDCLINNAGIGYIQELAEQPLEHQYSMFETNVLGLLNGIHFVIQDMKKNH